MPTDSIHAARQARVMCETAVLGHLLTLERAGADLTGGVSVDLVAEADAAGEVHRKADAVHIHGMSVAGALCREAEATILLLLAALTESTGLNLAAVEVLFTPPARETWRRRVHAVRIDLAV